MYAIIRCDVTMDIQVNVPEPKEKTFREMKHAVTVEARDRLVTHLSEMAMATIDTERPPRLVNMAIHDITFKDA